VLFYPGQTNSNEKRASFIGLGLEHDRYDLFLAIMECVSFEVLLKVLAFERMCGKIDVLTMTGGAAKSDVWKTVLSSVLNREVISIKNSDIAAIGAAVIASYGFGEQNDLKQSSKSVKVERRSVLPHHDIKNKYKEKFNRYLEFRKFCTM